MLLYNLRLAWKSIQRHPVLSGLIILGIALGVGVATTFITVYHVLARDPLPGRSDRLYYVRMNTWGGSSPLPDGVPFKITYRDAQAVRASDIPVRQTSTAGVELVVRPAARGREARPFRQDGRLVNADFFEMFGAPFEYGSGWSREADRKPEAVMVIGAALNDRLFGGENSVGRTVRLENQDFRVVGVLASWRPSVRPYDLWENPVGSVPEEIFIPFEWVSTMGLRNADSTMAWDDEPDLPFAEQLQSSERLWVQHWVELPDAARRDAFQSFLTAYAAEQHRLGRFPLTQEVRLTPLLGLMEENGVVPPQAKVLALISLLFLAVASVNLIGLFLGKFLARAPVVGVRRALGASRRAIFLQHLVECELIALAGGVAGIALALGTLAFINQALRDFATFRLDASMIAAAVLLSLLAGAIAGIYPAWRICAIPPARHLKNQ